MRRRVAALERIAADEAQAVRGEVGSADRIGRQLLVELERSIAVDARHELGRAAERIPPEQHLRAGFGDLPRECQPLRHQARVGTPHADHADQHRGRQGRGDRTVAHAALMAHRARQLPGQLRGHLVRHGVEVGQLLAQRRQFALLSQVAVDALGGHLVVGEMRHDLAIAPPVQLAIDEGVQIVVGQGSNGIVRCHGYFTTRSRATAPCVMS